VDEKLSNIDLPNELDEFSLIPCDSIEPEEVGRVNCTSWRRVCFIVGLVAFTGFVVVWKMLTLGKIIVETSADTNSQQTRQVPVYTQLPQADQATMTSTSNPHDATSLSTTPPIQRPATPTVADKVELSIEKRSAFDWAPSGPRISEPILQQGIPRSIEDQRVRQTAQEGIGLYWAGQYGHAKQRLEVAHLAERRNPIYLYFLGLCEYQLGDRESASMLVRQAARLEASHPIRTWGTTMERCQGATRVWLEEERRKGKSSTR
jgi:hypothetical protein